MPLGGARGVHSSRGVQSSRGTVQSTRGTMSVPFGLLARELGVRVPRERFEAHNQIRRVHGHKAEVFCVVFDRTGRLIITGRPPRGPSHCGAADVSPGLAGADDYMVKIWSAHSGLLLHSLRGHRGEAPLLCCHVAPSPPVPQITDLTVNIPIYRR
jgi:WD40 repeat protein